MPDRLIDISPLVSPSLAVWPGDTPPRREILLDLARDDNLTLSTLHTTVHVGAHADAPSHYGRDGRTIEEQPLDRYVGPCIVRRVTIRPDGLVRPADVDGLPKGISRVLLATHSYPDPTRFEERFAALSPETVHALADRGVTLVGIDTPSVDPFASKDLPAHHACLTRDVAILEGLRLQDVPDGSYELIALPLRLEGFDASPVRAVLRSRSTA